MKYMNFSNRLNNTWSRLINTGFFHVIASSAVNKIVSFATSFILVRLLSKSDYGVYAYANNIINFFMIASGLGATAGVLQLCSEANNDNTKENIYRYGCRLSLVANLFITFTIILMCCFTIFKIERARFYLSIMSFLPVFIQVHDMQSIFLRTELRNKEYSFSNIFYTIALLILSCVLAFFFGVGGLITAKYFAVILSIIFIVCKYRVGYPLKKSNLDKDAKRLLLSISGISMLNNGLSRLMYLLDIFVIGIIIPDSTVIASYQVATNIPTALAFIPAAIITYIYPYFAKRINDREWVIKRYKQITLVIGLGSMFITVIMIVFAPFIIRIVFGLAYIDAVPSFRILCLSFALSSTFRILPGNILATQRRLKFNLFVAVLSSVVNAVLNVIFINALGSIGAAIATIITVIVSSVLNVLYLRKTLMLIH